MGLKAQSLVTSLIAPHLTLLQVMNPESVFRRLTPQFPQWYITTGRARTRSSRNCSRLMPKESISNGMFQSQEQEASRDRLA